MRKDSTFRKWVGKDIPAESECWRRHPRLLLRKALCSQSTSCPLQLNGVVGQRMSPCCRWKIPSVHQLWMPLGLQMSCHSCHEGMLMETESMEALAWEIHGRDAGRHSTDDNWIA